MIQEKEFTRGLSTREAEKRIKTYGLNELKHKKKKSPVLIFLSQFNDFLVWVLMGATIISGFIGDKADAITILIIVIVNAILGFVQEFRTEKSLEALQEMAAPTCKAIRDGNIKVINSRELTIGDVVILEAGDRIPADGTFIDAANMVVDESLLTGESVGISKDTSKGKNEGYMGTIVLKGRGLLLIDSIGMETEMGKIANLLDNIEEEKSPLRERLDSLGKILVVVCVIVCIIVTALGILRGNDITEMFLLGVSLAVAAIPEGLAAIVTVALALGVSRMLKRNALIRKLPAVETLGCTSVICSDKTGTLTQNKMTVKEILTNVYENLFDLVIYAVNPGDIEDRLIKSVAEFNKLFKVHKIAAERELGETDEIRESQLGLLLGKILKDDIENTFPELKENIIKLQEDIVSKNKQAQEDINKSLTEIIKKAVKMGYPNEEKVEIKAQTNFKLESQIKNNTELLYSDNELDENLPSAYNGLGYKNLLKIRRDALNENFSH